MPRHEPAGVPTLIIRYLLLHDTLSASYSHGTTWAAKKAEKGPEGTAEYFQHYGLRGPILEVLAVGSIGPMPDNT